VKHSIKFFLYKYLHKEHSRFELSIFKFSCHMFCGFFAIPASIKDVVLREIEKNDLKNAMRRLSWLGFWRTRGILCVRDDYFDFSIGLNMIAAQQGYDFIKGRRNNNFLKQIALAQLSSAVLEAQVPQDSSRELEKLRSASYDDLYRKHLDCATSMLHDVKASTPHSSPIDQAVKSLAKDPQQPKVSVGARSNLMHKYGLKVLKKVLSIFADNGTPVFVISGTFLGLIREKNFIAHDYDIDLGVMEGDFNAELIKLFQAHQDFRVSEPEFPCFREVDEQGAVTYRRADVPALVKIYHKTGVQVDLFIHFSEEGDGIIRNLTW